MHPAREEMERKEAPVLDIGAGPGREFPVGECIDGIGTLMEDLPITGKSLPTTTLEEQTSNTENDFYY